MLKIAEKCPPDRKQMPGKKKSCGKSAPVSMPEIETSDTDKSALLCVACQAIITFESENIEVNGSFSHSFANPHGLFFDISCYRNAPGCINSAESSSEFTWFRGYDWQVAACQNCMNHLGWLFTSSANRFYGLISDQLIRSDAVGPEEA